MLKRIGILVVVVVVYFFFPQSNAQKQILTFGKKQGASNNPEIF